MFQTEVDPYFHFLPDFLSIEVIDIQNIHSLFSHKPFSFQWQQIIQIVIAALVVR